MPRIWGGGASGGSGGTTITGTKGSVLFINPNNTVSEDNANFFWATTAATLNLGTNTTNLSRLLATGTTLFPPTNAAASIPSYTTATCTGTVSTCASYVNNQAGCEAHKTGSSTYCTFTATCPDYNNKATLCGATTGCTYDPIACSDYNPPGTDTACNAISGCFATYVGDCTLVAYPDCLSAPYYGCTDGGDHCDGSYFTSCDGAYSGADCTGFTNLTDCTNHVGCTINYFDCTAEPDEASCIAMTGCSPNYVACSTWNGDQGTCEANGCTYPGNAGDCSAAPYPDCTGYPGCSDQGDHCDGTYDNGACTGGPSTVYSDCAGSPFDSCSGTYIDGPCIGTGGTCTGTAWGCSNFGTQSPCTAQGGCTWNIGANTYDAIGRQHRYKIYAYKTVGGIQYFSDFSQTTNVTDDNSGNGYNVVITWSAPTTYTPDGYRIFKSSNNVTYSQWKDINATSYTDGGSGSTGPETTPTAYLAGYFSGPVYVNPYIEVENANTTQSLSLLADASILINNTSGSGVSKVTFSNQGTSKGGISSDANGRMFFHAAANGFQWFNNITGAGTPAVSINSSGMGIGVTSPSNALEIAGNHILKLGNMALNSNNDETAIFKSNSSTAVALQLNNSTSSFSATFGARTTNSFFAQNNNLPFRFERVDNNGRNQGGIVAEKLALGEDSGTQMLEVTGNAIVMTRMTVGLNTAPTSRIYIAAGTGGANTAPIGIQPGGSLLSNPESCTIEQASDKLYFTIPTGTARKEITFNDSALSANRIPIVSGTSGRLFDTGSLTYQNNTLSPTYIKLGVGTAASGTEPLRFITGSLLTVPESGAFEYRNPDIFFTPDTGSRFNVPLVSGAAVQGDLIYASGSSVYSRLAKNTSATRYLANTGTSNNPSWDLIVLSNGVSGTLPVANGGTGQTASRRITSYAFDANNSGTTETDLYIASLTGSKLAVSGDTFFAQYAGIFSGAATSTQQLKVKFGISGVETTIFDTGALAIGAAVPAWDIYASVIRESASGARSAVSITTSSVSLATTAQYTTIGSLNPGSSYILKITGTAAGVAGASNQITAKMGYVDYEPI